MENMNPDYKASATYVFYPDKHLNGIMLVEGAHKAGLDINNK